MVLTGLLPGITLRTMSTALGKYTGKVKIHLIRRTVEALKPGEKSRIAWDDRLTGFSVRVQPSGIKSFIVNYCPGDGGRKAPNRCVVIGRYGRMAPDNARDMLGRVARGEDPAEERAEARGVSTLAEAFETYMKANPNRTANTVRLYRQNLRVNLGGWLKRPLDAITRQTRRIGSISSPASTAGRQRTRRFRCCTRSTAGPASTTRRCAIRLSRGSPRASASTSNDDDGRPSRAFSTHYRWGTNTMDKITTPVLVSAMAISCLFCAPAAAQFPTTPEGGASTQILAQPSLPELSEKLCRGLASRFFLIPRKDRDNTIAQSLITCITKYSGPAL